VRFASDFHVASIGIDPSNYATPSHLRADHEPFALAMSLSLASRYRHLTPFGFGEALPWFAQ